VETNGSPQSKQSFTRPRFELGTSRIRRNDIHSSVPSVSATVLILVQSQVESCIV
jgi:hypothetical protein